MVLIGVISLFIFIYFPSRLKNQAIEASVDKAQSIAEMTAFSISSALFFDDVEGAQEVIEGAKQNEDLIYIVVLDDSGDLFIAFNQDEADRIDLMQTEKQSLRMSQDGMVYEIMTPILNGDEEIGQLFLGISFGKLRKEIDRSRVNIALVSGLIFLIGIIAVLGISTLVTRPLSQMMQTVERIAQGDLTQRATLSSRDEVGHLAESFNLMVDTVEERTKELQEEIKERKRREALQLSRQWVLEKVWQMKRPDDIQQVLVTIKENLKMLAIGFQDFAVTLVDTSCEPPTVQFYSLQEGWEELPPDKGGETIIQVWHRGVPFYRRDLDIEDTYQERHCVEATYGHPVRAILDVPFSHGTLSVNSPKPHAFSDQDVVSLQLLAEVLSEAFRRRDDLQTLEQTEEQLRHSQKMEAIGQLASGMAHDFNNLLTVITGHCQLLLMVLDEDDPKYQSLEQVNKAGGKAATLIRQLLTFSRREVVQPEVLDLNKVVENLEKMLGRLIGENIELITATGSALGKVKADPGQLEQVIMNLAVNARDAMPGGGKLTIETENVELDEADAKRFVDIQPGSYVVLTVKDTGIGMDAETRERIFEPFFTTKDVGKGTGLGLSTAYGIIKQGNGHIQVFSEPGEGTTFEIYLPQVGGKEIDRQSQILAETTIPQGAETVLLAEDDETVRQLAEKILRQYGYTVLEAKNGEEALQVGARHNGPIHLLLTDVMMTGMNGHELADHLLSTRPELKVVYMSGYMDDTVSRHILEESETNFIQKPFSPNDLMRKVHESLNRSRLEKV